MDHPPPGWIGLTGGQNHGPSGVLREVLIGKIHNATVTGAEVEYVGSIGIDSDLVEKADLWPGQKVLVVSNTTGERLETYIIPESAGSGAITMRGGAARRIGKGEEIIILGFALSDEPLEAKAALVDSENRFVRYL